MKLVTVIVFGLLLFGRFSVASTSSEEWNEVSTPSWISSPEKSWAKLDVSCDLYRSYWVVTVEMPDQVGSDIFVFKRNAKSRFPKDCNSDHRKAWMTYKGDDNDIGRASIHDDILFLDAGTSNWRGLSVISLANKKRIASMSYNGSQSSFSIEGNELVYHGLLEPTDERSRLSWKMQRKCEWDPKFSPKEYYQENYSGTVKLNLKTGYRTVVGVTCEIGPAAG